MSCYLGIDTSNYTTSVALYDPSGSLVQEKQLLPVREGELGLRQSDAVFEHTRQLPRLSERCLANVNGGEIGAVAASERPRDSEGSYMPCFLAGVSAAKTAACACGVPYYGFSHQAGHIAAALYSTGNLALVGKTFICFHFSGGTTDCLLVTPSEEHVFRVRLLATSLDLKAGQAVDRVGRMLGLRFPAGAALSALAGKSGAGFKVSPAFKGADVSLSGVENKCAAMVHSGASAEDVACLCLSYICAAADRMTQNALRECGQLPVIYAGGVMSSEFIRARLAPKYGGAFAQPQFSSDNAAGIAVLAYMKEHIL